jgi:hypothetical protein
MYFLHFHGFISHTEKVNLVLKARQASLLTVRDEVAAMAQVEALNTDYLGTCVVDITHNFSAETEVDH